MSIINWKSKEEIEQEIIDAEKAAEEQLNIQAIALAVQKLIRTDGLSKEENSTG